ncbi:MAG: hypothetical protein HKN22_06565 [Bacteroidia bacterium]|nr:hypothetical protein [Bacteroidia bacterium]
MTKITLFVLFNQHMRQAFFLIFLFFITDCCIAQKHILKKQKFIYGSDLAFNLTRAGYSANLAFNLKYGGYQFYAGPKISLDQLSNSENTPLGLVAGFRAYPHFYHEHRLDTYFNFDYQLVRWNSACTKNCSDEKDLIHELNVGFGFAYKLTYKFQLNAAVLAGAFTESLYNERLEKRETYIGYNNLFRFGIIYEFNATERQWK